jgi:hypothetical protein
MPFLRLVYSMLPVSLDCPFLIAPSVFSNVYLTVFWNYSESVVFLCDATFSMYPL